jgi:hypothetical protein
LRECLPFFIFVFVISLFWDFSVSGSALGHIASLEGVCWIFGRLCERAQCADPRNSGTFPIPIVFVRASGP